MRAILLCAGFATRLRPLTDDRPKPLLPVRGRPLVDDLVDQLLATGRVDQLEVVTNARFARHFEAWPLEDRYKEAHVAKVLDCNWKVVQEAFMEAYHVVATHPQLLAGIGDANSQYDVYGNFSRALTPSGTST